MSSVFVSSMCLGHDFSLPDVFQRYQTSGIKAIELGSGHKVQKGLIETLPRLRFEFVVHNYFPLDDPNHLLNIASHDKRRLAKTLQISRDAILLSHRLGSKFYSIHAGFRTEVNPRLLGSFLAYDYIVPYEEAYKTMVRTIQELCNIALPLGIDVLVENHVLASFNLVGGKNSLLLLCEADEFVRFVKDVGRDNFGFLLDFGHLNVTANTLGFDSREFIEITYPWIKAFHLSDNDGRTDKHLAFDDDTWFSRVVQKLSNLPCVIECKVDDENVLTELVERVHYWRSGY